MEPSSSDVFWRMLQDHHDHSRTTGGTSTTGRNESNKVFAAPASSTFVALCHKNKNYGSGNRNENETSFKTTAGVPTTTAPSPAPGSEQTTISQTVLARIINSNNNHDIINNNVDNMSEEAKTPQDDPQHDPHHQPEQNEQQNMMIMDFPHDQHEEDNMDITDLFNDGGPMFCEQQQLLLQLQPQPQQQQPHTYAYAVNPSQPQEQQQHDGEGNRTYIDVFNVDPKAVDQLTSAELKSLSADQREQLLEELHGISSPYREETPELIDESLRQMEYELQYVIPGTHPTKAHAYLLARSLNSHFVMRTDVRLKFLRCVFFDVPKATIRFLKYLDVVLDYYGVAGLMRPISLDDLDDEELALMKQGEVQLLPERDHPLGRRVGVTFGVKPKNARYSNRCRMKVAMYMIWAMSEDVDTQIYGALWVYFDQQSDWRSTSPERWSEASRFAESMPVRTAGLHFCFPDINPIMSKAVAAIMMQMGKALRIRSRVYGGSITEINYNLMSFSIPVDSIPIRSSGEVKTKNHLQWIESRLALEHAIRHAEQSQTPFGDVVVECPRPPDVVFKVGERGTRPGNIKLRELVEDRHTRYQTKASRSVKNQVIQEIVAGIKAVGGRFLVWDKRGWYVVLKDPAVIKKHISTYIRDYKNRRSNQRSSETNFQVLRSSTKKFL
mmetsp:Transcript_15531/g.38694  ORF Transcript_15531/g.38694 Transcript_15531/m.38694 type:complete len:667 (+) Transcript_15531:84-2084(+)